MKLAEDLLRGRGVELGRAAHNPLAPYDCISVAPSDGVNALEPEDLADYQVYVAEQRRCGQGPARVDCIAEAIALPFGDGELDYVASSHVLEHLPDMFGAWMEWERVLKPGGINFMIVPKRFAEPTDSSRPITHLDDLVAARERRDTPRSLLPGQPWRSHYHVFILQVLLAALNWYNANQLGCWLLEAVEETDSKVGNGHTLVLRKAGQSLPGLEQLVPEMIGSFRKGDDFAQLALLARQILSQNFRVHDAWLVWSLAEEQLGNKHAALEAMTQALILQPCNGEFRQRYQQLSGRDFVYPLSLVDYLARLL
ncbi:class I SAM-dependent methyltransferase [Chromobacterium paludis]|uniref:Class I SAM-dependent methyltransferase n=1 Tax=Chromobacterium paludis TaxID=2605945 RepID=A0A5C1DK94_9NEIS|nr:class I SAM-dependent methyltransferase [Chromobacterium paludis]QEL57115.1 class I SAM-dependent methyltransferase [Chromobacterium paludis]